jgi:hypothetical protein
MHVLPQSDTDLGRLLRSHPAACPAPTLRARSKGTGGIKDRAGTGPYLSSATGSKSYRAAISAISDGDQGCPSAIRLAASFRYCSRPDG